MPTYEYQCPKGHRFEILQKMSDPPVAECTQCGASAERVISGGAGFLLRGDGFYITDYRSDDYKTRAAKEREASSGTSSDGGSSTGAGSAASSDGPGGVKGSDSGAAAKPSASTPDS